MKVHVKLFGTLGQRFSGYDPLEGLEVEIPEGADVSELLSKLGIAKSDKGVVVADGRIIETDETLDDGSSVGIFQAVFGG